MLRHPAIAEVCVVAMPDSRQGEAVKAFVVLRETQGQTVSEQDIIQWCRGEFATYKCPARIEIVSQIPRSATGKVDWRTLQEREGVRPRGAA